MSARRGEVDSGKDAFARFAPLSYATIQEELTCAMVRKQVGRNGWAVMVALCYKIYADGRLGRASADEIAGRTGLTNAQIARGMAELRNKGIIAPIERKTREGCCQPDRSNYGHVAQYHINARPMENLPAWLRSLIIYSAAICRVRGRPWRCLPFAHL